MTTEPSPLDPFASDKANQDTVDLAPTQTWGSPVPEVAAVGEALQADGIAEIHGTTLHQGVDYVTPQVTGAFEGVQEAVNLGPAESLDSSADALGLGSAQLGNFSASDAGHSFTSALGATGAISGEPVQGESVLGATGGSGLAAGAAGLATDGTGLHVSSSGNDGGSGGGGPSFPPPSSNGGFNEPPKKKRKLALLGVGLGVLGLAGGAAFAFSQIKGTEKANTPEQAIETFYTSFENGDAIGLAKTLAPGERDVMLDSMVPMLAEMSRLKVLEKDFDPSKIKGYTAKVTAFKAKSTVVRPDLAHVVVTSGKLSTTFNPNDLPFGDFVRKLGGDDLKKSKSTTQSSDIGTKADSPFVVQKIGKRWYLSLNYSIAESARLQSEDVYKVPLKGGGVAAKGAATPEAAVSDMMQAMADLNVRRIIELVPPDEFAALHDYAGQFIDSADDGVKEVSKKYKLKVTPKLLTSKIADDRVVVTINDLPFNLKVDDPELKVRANYAAKVLDASIDTKDGSKGKLTWKNKVLDGSFTSPEGETVSAKYAKECLTIKVDGDEKKGCGQEGLAKLFSDISGQQIDTSTLNSEGLGFSSKCKPSNNGKPSIGFTVIKREGAWYVSPTRTMLDSVTAVMKKLEPKDIDCLRDQIETSIKSLTNQNDNPDAIDPTFIDPTDPNADPFATDTFPDFPVDSSMADEDIFADDTFDESMNSSDTFSPDEPSALTRRPLKTRLS
jgi:hypothetical protein